MLNIVVPMAGRGSRFTNAGYTIPKPLIPVGGKPMIQWVIENITPSQPHRFTFICLKEHLTTYPEVPATLSRLCPGCHIVQVDKVTEGAACTVLLAKDIINNDSPLMIANADQYVELDIDEYLEKMQADRADGIIMTFWADHPKWSYCLLARDSTVSRVVEKEVVSNDATVGIYNFKKGHDFVRAAEQMISKNLRVNGEFYVAPAFNQLIAEGAKLIIKGTGREYEGMYGLGTPDDLNFFLTTALFRSRALALKSDTVSCLYRRMDLCALFVRTRNIAGLRALLTKNAQLESASGTIEGSDNIVRVLTNTEPNSAQLTYFLAGDKAVLELKVKTPKNLGLNLLLIITWSEEKISHLHAYHQAVIRG